MLVLIVDHSVQIINRLEELLSEAKHIRTIHKTVSYKEAISFYKQNKPDILLMDTGLPANRSVDLINWVKKLIDDTTIIVLSIHTDTVTKEQFNSLGADFILDKYYDFEKLPGIVDAIGASKKSVGLIKY